MNEVMLLRKKWAAVLLCLFLTTACSVKNPAPKPLPAAPPNTGEAQNTSPAPASQDQKLANEVTSYMQRFEGKAGLYAKNLRTEETVALHEHEIFPTASTHKLVVALAIYKYLYAEATLEKKKQYDVAIKKMMTISDNPAFYELLREIEKKKPDALTQVLTDLKLTHTRIHSGEAFKQYGYHSVTTPYEMAIVFETIYREEYLGREMSAILKEELAKTIFREEIPRYMLNNKVLHKVGELPEGILCDVGIVDDGKDQILISAYTVTKRPPPYGSNFIANLAAKSYNALRVQ
jgi:beta-lactamase class A